MVDSPSAGWREGDGALSPFLPLEHAFGCARGVSCSSKIAGTASGLASSIIHAIVRKRRIPSRGLRPQRRRSRASIARLKNSKAPSWSPRLGSRHCAASIADSCASAMSLPLGTCASLGTPSAPPRHPERDGGANAADASTHPSLSLPLPSPSIPIPRRRRPVAAVASPTRRGARAPASRLRAALRAVHLHHVPRRIDAGVHFQDPRELVSALPLFVQHLVVLAVRRSRVAPTRLPPRLLRRSRRRGIHGGRPVTGRGRLGRWQRRGGGRRLGGRTRRSRARGARRRGLDLDLDWDTAGRSGAGGAGARPAAAA